ncbi:conserved hypothetical protein, DUF1501; putative exported protein [Cupriavidus taiwanensis]|uniref:DUF1501 domain-containing protein n=1 Tax=Cupriavidus taiwanensis TaxID=164546 RepID=A0A375CFV8_9BURK|nr:DUF1501 domain-containing protein [Cupriavidus taiwanensis]SOY69002.1 conserved hypothetical protein, DUF1501; putative exported protein [Cupriavidus taiwanensis]
MQRRQWLRTMGGAALGLALPAVASRVYALPAQADARFLLVFLRGGYDAASVLVPAGSDFYYAARPNIAIRRPPAPGADADSGAAVALASAIGADSAARGIGDWALHPALAPSLLPLWQQGQLAFVPFAGTHDLSRSHFETQDGIEAGLPGNDESRQAVAALRGSGFLNRLAQAMGGQAAPVAFTDGLPLVLSGPRDVPNVSLKGAGRAPFDARQATLLAQMYRGTRFASLIDEGFALRETVAREAQAQASKDGMAGAGPATMASRQQEMQAASRRALSARGFEVEARRMAGLLRERFNLGFIDVGGWDTHVNQGAAQGQLAGLLDNLGRGLSAFAAEMGPAWSQTTVVVVSEFGRTFRENGTRGTDHGHGTVYWVLGGSVRGGRIAGEQVAVEPATLNQNRDWPVRNEYRALLGGLFRRLYGLDEARLAQVFPGVTGRDIGLV